MLARKVRFAHTRPWTDGKSKVLSIRLRYVKHTTHLTYLSIIASVSDFSAAAVAG